MRIRRIIIGLLIAVAVIFAVVMFNPAAMQWIFDRGAMQLSGRTNTELLRDDALRVANCGSSAPLPSKSRAKACVAVFAGGKFYVVDVGPESVENLVLWRIPLSEVGGVLLTHFHSDHIGRSWRTQSPDLGCWKTRTNACLWGYWS